MREILFRGKRVDTKEWIEGSLITLDSTLVGDHRYIVDKSIKTNLRRVSTKCNEHDWRAFGVEPSTVGQYTGLKDRNGKMIFEGDVVFAGYGEYYQGQHEHSTTTIIDMADYEALNALCNANIVQVIGNIHDNPELLT